MMQIGLGILKWTPGDFWQSTPYELTTAMEGLARSKGYGGQFYDGQSSGYRSRADLIILAKKYQEKNNASLR